MMMKRAGALMFFCASISLNAARAQEVRPIRDDVGYCWNSTQMKRMIDYVSSHEVDTMTPGRVVAGISPHDDYLYAARVYYPLFRSLRAKEAIIFGVTHRTVRSAIGDPRNIVILDGHSSWRGMSGNVEISPLREFMRRRLDTSYFVVNNKAHELEHSIEGLIPYLQYFCPGVRITPVMITAMPFERMDKLSGALSQVISDYLRTHQLLPGRDFVFLISSDANHYGQDFNNSPFGEDETAHQKATGRDRAICTACLAGTLTNDKIHELTGRMDSVVWCGQYSVPFGLLTIKKTMRLLGYPELRGTILRYSDSYTEGVIPLQKSGMGITAPFSARHWVGWFSAAYSVTGE